MKNGVIESWNGSKHWYVYGERHRTDGPAIEYSDGSKQWYRSGYPYGISFIDGAVRIGCKSKPSIAAWDEWFSGNEEFNHKRCSPEFSVLLQIWGQFKRQAWDGGGVMGIKE